MQRAQSDSSKLLNCTGNTYAGETINSYECNTNLINHATEYIRTIKSKKILFKKLRDRIITEFISLPSEIT